jgi:hypothetical protein
MSASLLPDNNRLAATSILLPSLAAGIFTALVGTAAFGIAHAVIIGPIWESIPGGIPFALTGGLAMGWAFSELHARDKVSLTYRGGLGFGLIIWLMLIPMTAFGVLLRESGMREAMGDLEVVAESAIAFLTGALVGWLLTHAWRPALAVGTAMLFLTFVMGGPIAVMKTAHGAYLFGTFLIIYAVCGATLVAILIQLIRLIKRWQAKAVRYESTAAKGK